MATNARALRYSIEFNMIPLPWLKKKTASHSSIDRDIEAVNSTSGSINVKHITVESAEDDSKGEKHVDNRDGREGDVKIALLSSHFSRSTPCTPAFVPSIKPLSFQSSSVLSTSLPSTPTLSPRSALRSSSHQPNYEIIVQGVITVCLMFFSYEDLVIINGTFYNTGK